MNTSERQLQLDGGGKATEAMTGLVWTCTVEAQ